MHTGMMLDKEVHPTLNEAQMFAIRDFREKVAWKTPDESMKLLFEWVKTGRITYRKFAWCVDYLTKGN